MENKKRLIQLMDDQGEIMLMETTLTDEEIESVDMVYEDEQYDDMDYEEKLSDMADRLEAKFERVYYSVVLI